MASYSSSICCYFACSWDITPLRKTKSTVKISQKMTVMAIGRQNHRTWLHPNFLRYKISKHSQTESRPLTTTLLFNQSNSQFCILLEIKKYYSYISNVTLGGLSVYLKIMRLRNNRHIFSVWVWYKPSLTYINKCPD